MIRENTSTQLQKLRAGMRVKETIIKDLSRENERMKIIIEALVEKIQRLKAEKENLREALKNVGNDFEPRGDDSEEGN